METKFTKGNWYIHQYIAGRPSSIIQTDTYRKPYQSSIICDVNGVGTDEGKANASLIMASKDLFNACVKFTENVDKWLKTGIPADKLESKDIYDNAKKAINKALGK